MQRTYSNYYEVATPGLMSGLGSPRIFPHINGGTRSIDKYSVAVPATPANNTAYTITVNAIPVTFKTDAAATQAQLELGLLNALRSNPQVFSSCDVALDTAAHTISLTAREFNQTINVSVTPNLVLTHPQVASPLVTQLIPFGRFVVRRADLGYEVSYRSEAASLPTGPTDEIVGITLSTHAVEKVGIGSAIIGGGYPSGEVMNVLNRTNDIKGIWMEAIETDIIHADAAYASYAPGQEGKVTKSPTNAIPVASMTQFLSECQICQGKNLVLVSFNLK